MSAGGGVTRRRLLELLGAGAVSVAGAWLASRRVPADVATGPTTTTSSTVPRAEEVPEVAPEPPEEEEPAAPEPAEPYEPVPGEVEPDAKRAAARVVEQLTTYEAGGAEAAAAEVVAASLGPGDTGVVAEAWPLLVEGAASAGRVVYPQLGGLDPHADPQSCSVMVVVAQRLLDGDGEERSVSRCVDVRLRRVDGTWRLERVADASGQPVPRPPVVSDAARAVLDAEAVDLPDSARWDIHEGIVDDRVLRELLFLAERASVSVTCFRRGHPERVFGTDRRSAHMAGLAVDIWAVGEEAVVQQQPQQDETAHALAGEVYVGQRASNFGSPWAFDGFGGRSFTDPVHRDHFHLGFSASVSTPPPPPADGGQEA